MGDAQTRVVILTLSASNFVIGMGAFVLIGLVQPMAQDLDLSPGRVGTALTTYAVAYAILSPVLVAVTGFLGRRRLLFIAMATFAAGNLLTALAPGEVVLHLSRIIAAAGAGMFTPVTSSVAAALAAPEERGRALAAVLIGLTVAQAAGVPLGGFIGYTFGWRAGFAIVAALALPCLWLVWTRVPKGLSIAPARLGDLGRTLIDWPTMLAIAFTATFLGAAFTLYTYLAPLLETRMDFGRNGVTAILVVYGVGAIAGNVMGGRMADRLGAFRTLWILAGAQILIVPVFSVLPLPVAALVALVFLWSLFGWSFAAGQQMRLLAIRPDQPGVVLALNAAAIYVGAALGSAIGGGVLEAAGPSALGVATSAIFALSLVHIVVSRRISGH